MITFNTTKAHQGPTRVQRFPKGGSSGKREKEREKKRAKNRVILGRLGRGP